MAAFSSRCGPFRVRFEVLNSTPPRGRSHAMSAPCESRYVRCESTPSGAEEMRCLVMYISCSAAQRLGTVPTGPSTAQHRTALAVVASMYPLPSHPGRTSQRRRRR